MAKRTPLGLKQYFYKYVGSSKVNTSITLQQLKYEGLVAFRWLDRWMEGIQQMAQWIKEGKVKSKETVVNGFENMPEAFKDLFTGANVGKMVVKI